MIAHITSRVGMRIFNQGTMRVIISFMRPKLDVAFRNLRCSPVFFGGTGTKSGNITHCKCDVCHPDRYRSSRLPSVDWYSVAFLTVQ